MDAQHESRVSKVVERLYDINAVKFGEFTMKSGFLSPIYFDLRVIVSFPEVMNEVSSLMWEVMEAVSCQYSSLCGVPYTALPIATCICKDHNIPMLIRRKEAKDYGTKKMIEGSYKTGDVCLVVEDVVTSGSSVMETTQSLVTAGLCVSDAVVLLDRQQGGRDALQSHSINLHSVVTMSALMDILHKAGRVGSDTVDRVKQYINHTKVSVPSVINSTPDKAKILPYKDRAALCDHPLSRQLFNIMSDKCSNLALSADVCTAQELIKLADTVGPHVCILKTHIDILADFTPDVTHQLTALAAKHNFIIFEDRKFADIGNTVRSQYSGGVYRISDWAHLVNAHPLPGPGIIRGLKEVGLPKERGLLLLAQMSSEGSLATGDYTKAAVKMAEDHKEFVIGFICREQLISDPSFIHMTPGVQLNGGGDSLGQQYLTPSDVIKRGSDIIIVGRGITKATNPVETARLYQEAGYQAYLDRLQAQ